MLNFDTILLDRIERNQILIMKRNFLYRKIESKNWNNLTDSQKAAIESGINQLNQGKGITHEKVIEELKKKYKIKL